MFKSIIKASAIATIAVVSAISFAEARGNGGGAGGGGGGNGGGNSTPEVVGLHAIVPSVTFAANNPGQSRGKHRRTRSPGPNDCANMHNPKVQFVCHPD